MAIDTQDAQISSELLNEQKMDTGTMEIKRIDTYRDERFSQKVLNQHGCFLVEDAPYEVEILSDFEAVIRGDISAVYPAVIEEFRFYTPHITRFYDEANRVVKDLSPVQLLTICLDQIQPSQFYVDEDKLAAVNSFIHKADDIIIQVLPYQGGYVSLDGHTRLYCAVKNGWKSVRAIAETSDDWVYGFVEEAQKRNIYTPKDLMLVSHKEYEEKWNQFCDTYFAKEKTSPTA